MAKSVLDAIRDGDWFYEPVEVDCSQFNPTTAVPGTREKLEVLAFRVQAGLPLWHDRDRPDYEEFDATEDTNDARAVSGVDREIAS